MNKLLATELSIYVKLDDQTVYDYFNHHDPAPLYKRQLGQQFQQYIYHSMLTTKRDAIIRYKFICLQYADKRFVEPVTQAIRSHFNLAKYIKEEEFKKFKRRTFILLMVSMSIVLTAQGTLPYLIDMDNHMASSVHSILDVFSWVIMWKPIDRLIFYWNPYKKEIHLLNRLANAEVTVLEKEKIIPKNEKKAS